MVRKRRKPLNGQRSPRVYDVYGLCVKSHFPLPCPELARPGPEVVELFRGSTSLFSSLRQDAKINEGPEKWFQHVRLADGSTYLRWTGHFEFLVSDDGHWIACRPLNGTSTEALHTYLLGQVLSFALLKLGIEPLHCTVAVVDDGAVGFMGDCGYGKSSLGAAFLHAGHSLLTDDLLVAKEVHNGFLAYPGIPRIKLFRGVGRRFLRERVTGTRMNNLTRKLILPLDSEKSCRVPVPLRAIYVLGRPPAEPRSNRITIRPLSQRRALLAVLKNTFNNVVVDTERLKCQFIRATRIVSRVPIRLLSYPRRLTLLPEVREAILSDLMR